MNIQKNGINLLLVAEALLLIVVLVLGVFAGATGAVKKLTSGTEGNQIAINTEGKENQFGTDKDPTTEPGSDVENPEGTKWEVPEDYSEGRLSFPKEVEAKLSEMTVEQKVAQLFIVSPEALTGYRQVTVFGAASKQAFDRYPVGGLVYNTTNFQNAEQTQSMLKAAQTYYKEKFGILLLTAIEEEGGANNSPLAVALGHERTPSASELGAQGATSVIEQAVKSRVNYAKADGFNLMLSTVGDVAPSLDTAYRLRTYGTDVSVVSQLVAADIAAIQSNGMLSTLKYFPGIAQATDNGAGILYDNQSMQALCEGSLLSYKAGIDAGANFVMVSNVIMESITDDENVPCSLSSRTTALIRKSMGFGGVLITDNFSDEKFVAVYGTGAACVEAIKAGMDMIYMPADFAASYSAVLEAVNNGNISADRLDNAVGRILMAKGL